MFEYPYQPFEPREEIELINFLVEVLYPTEKTKATKDKIRKRIRYHQKIGSLPLQYTTTEFFNWACSEWKDLRNKATGFPQTFHVVCCGVSRNLPPLPDDLGEGYISLYYENQQLKADLENAKVRGERLKRELINAKKGTKGRW